MKQKNFNLMHNKAQNYISIYLNSTDSFEINNIKNIVGTFHRISTNMGARVAGQLFIFPMFYI